MGFTSFPVIRSGNDASIFSIRVTISSAVISAHLPDKFRRDTFTKNNLNTAPRSGASRLNSNRS